MAAPSIHLNGYGGSVGAAMLTRAPIYTPGAVWYVHHSGSNSYSGTDRVKPVATLAQAHTLAAAGDAIVVLEGHAETITVAQSLNKAGIRVRGEGSGTTRPKFTCGAAIAMFDITAAAVWLENLYFPASTAAPTARIRIAGAGSLVKGCDFECGASDTGPAVQVITGGHQLRVVSTKFTSTASAVTAQPSIGLEVLNAVTDLELDTVTFDGGTVGWSSFAFKGTAAVTRLVGIDLAFLNDSDWTLASNTSGEMHVKTRSGSARGVWTP